MLTAFSKLEAPPLNTAPNGMDLLQRVERIESVLLRLVAQIAALERQLRSCTSLKKGLPKSSKSERKGVETFQWDGYGNHLGTRPRISVRFARIDA